MVENSWILDVDHVNKILQQDLAYYERIINLDNYRLFQTVASYLVDVVFRQWPIYVKNKAWYSRKMSLDALTYILCAANIVAGLEDLRTGEEEGNKLNSPWSELERKRLHDLMFAVQLKEWGVKSSKLVAVLNPEYGNFLSKFAELFEYFEKEKREGR